MSDVGYVLGYSFALMVSAIVVIVALAAIKRWPVWVLLKTVISVVVVACIWGVAAGWIFGDRSAYPQVLRGAGLLLASYALVVWLLVRFFVLRRE